LDIEINGAPAGDYAIDRDGNRVREQLFLMLKRRGLKESGLKTQCLASKNVHEMFSIVCSTYASLLEKYGQDIIGDSETALTV
jgi:hypothetical protein